jgi:hypothetical protein
LKCGDLVVMAMGSAVVVAAITMQALVADIIILRLFLFKEVGLILFVLVVFMDAALENV